MRKVRNLVLDFLSGIFYPPLCPICGKEGRVGSGWMCAECWGQLPPARAGLWNQDESLKGLVKVVFQYGDSLRQAIHKMKFGGRWDIALYLAQEAVKRVKHQYETYPWDTIVPIPLHTIRLRERGYDQTLLIARTLSENWSIPCREDLIVRIRHRTPQSHLPDHLRRINLKDAFALHPSFQSPPNGKVLLVDDVIHTGATAREAMKVLRAARIDDINILAICG